MPAPSLNTGGAARPSRPWSGRWADLPEGLARSASRLPGLAPLRKRRGPAILSAMSETCAAADVVIVGGGIVGCTVARAGARSGLSVLVLEEGRPGRKATWAAGGMLSPFGEADRPGPFLELGLESLKLYPDFVGSVEEASGRRVGYLECGKLELALDDAAESGLRRHLEWLENRGHPVAWLDPGEVHAREPLLTRELRGALLLKGEAQVDNRLLGPAVAAAAEVEGARFRSGERVLEVLVEGGTVAGVRLDGGVRIRAPRVVVAAGAWSGGLDGLPRRLPVRPVRGQMVALGGPPRPLSTVVDTSRAYLIPRRRGPVVVGSTMEEAGFRAETTAEGIVHLLGAAIEAAPGLARARVQETWAGLRPGTPDGLPILGPDPDVPGLFYATGHFRNGILLAPITGACLAPLLAGTGRPPVDLAPFRPDRFPPEERSVSE